MSADRRLVLEILSGPLDGAAVTLEAEETLWSRTGDGPLVFPWDIELGAPQARFCFENDAWWLEGFETPHGTYRINRGERVGAKVALTGGDVLKASNTWLLVREIA